MSKPTPPVKPSHPCECSKWGLACTSETRARFAPGHDARLKSHLIRAGIAGVEVSYREGTMVTQMDPITAARRFGFSFHVEDGIERGKTKVANRTHRATATEIHSDWTEKASETADCSRCGNPDAQLDKHTKTALCGDCQSKLLIKIGRWTYQPVSDTRYATRDGDVKTIPRNATWVHPDAE